MVHPGRSWTAAGPVRARAPTSAFSSADFPQFYPSDINKLRVFVNLIERERERALSRARHAVGGERVARCAGAREGAQAAHRVAEQGNLRQTLPII